MYRKGLRKKPFLFSTTFAFRIMPVSLKHLFSYLFELPLKKVYSPINGSLKVVLDRGVKKLVAQKAVYSYEDRYTCFRDFFLEFSIDQFPINQALVLGYGLGSVPLMLDRLVDGVSYDGVEIDQAIVDLNQEFGYCPDNVTVHTVDAMDFVEFCDKKYDLVVVDLFIDAIVPSKFETVRFLEACSKLLVPNGLLLFNRVAYPKAALEKTEIFYDEVFARTLDAPGIFKTRGNRMLWAFKDP